MVWTNYFTILDLTAFVEANRLWLLDWSKWRQASHVDWSKWPEVFATEFTRNRSVDKIILASLSFKRSWY